MKKVTVIGYLIERRHEIGVDDIFGVREITTCHF